MKQPSAAGMKSKVFKGLFWKFGERVSAQLITLVVSIVLARILTPHDYGVVAIVMIFIAIANVFVSSGFGNALVQKKNADNLDFSSVFYINIGVGVVLYAVLFLTAPLIASFYGMPVLSPVLRVVGIRLVVASVNTVQQAYVSRHLLFKRFFWSTLFGTLISGVVGIAMAYSGFGVWALVAQYLTNTCTDTVVLWFTVKWRPERRCSWKRAKGLFTYGWKMLVSGLIDTGYRQLRGMIIGKKYTSEDLAFYDRGDKLPSLIITNINASISSVIFPTMSKFQDDRERLKQMTRRAIQISAYILWPFMVGFAVVAEPFVRLVLTEKWLPCVPYIRIFCLSYGLWPIHTANLQAITAVGRSDLFLKLEIIKKGLGLAVLLIFMQISPLAMAYSMIITDVAAIFINAAPNIKLLQYSYTEQLRDLLTPLLMSAVMGAVIFPLQWLPIPDAVVLLLMIPIGAGIYLLESAVTKHPSYCYLLKLIKEKLPARAGRKVTESGEV